MELAKHSFFILFTSQLCLRNKLKKYFFLTKTWFIRLLKVKNLQKFFFFNFQNQFFPLISNWHTWTLLILKLWLMVYTLAENDIYEDRAYWFLKSPKRGFRFVKKTLKSRLTPSILFIFKFSLLIWVSFLKKYTPWKFGVHSFILHENRLFDYDLLISL